MERVERTFYPDGKLKTETHYLNGKEHGPYRWWHPNGVLHGEALFENGALGTYIGRIWSETGKLQSELPFRNGQPHGCLVVFDETGRATHRQFFVNGGKVSKARYQRLLGEDATRPTLDTQPTATGTPPGAARASLGASTDQEDARSTAGQTGSDAKVSHERFVSEMLATRNEEAIAWLGAGNPDGSRYLGEWHPDESMRFVKQFYDSGAVSVLAVDISVDDTSGEQSCNYMLVELPTDQSVRRGIFALNNEHAEELGFEGEPDWGQRHLFLMLC